MQKERLFPLSTEVVKSDITTPVKDIAIRSYILTSVREEFDSDFLVVIEAINLSGEEINYDDCPADSLEEANAITKRFKEDTELQQSFVNGDSRDFLR